MIMRSDTTFEKVEKKTDEMNQIMDHSYHQKLAKYTGTIFDKDHFISFINFLIEMFQFSIQKSIAHPSLKRC